MIAMSMDGVVPVHPALGTMNGDKFIACVSRSLVQNMLPLDGGNPRSIAILSFFLH